MTYYVTISEKLSGNKYVAASIGLFPQVTNLDEKICVRGWLGTTDNISRTALGEFSSVEAARKAARAGIRARGWTPRQMEQIIDYDRAEIVGYRIEARPCR